MTNEQHQQTIPNSFIALKTSFIISWGFDWERIPKCHLAFFNDAGPAANVVEPVGFLFWVIVCWELLMFGDNVVFVSIGSNVTLKSFKAKNISLVFIENRW